MGAILFIIAIAIANIGLGYGLAIYLARPAAVEEREIIVSSQAQPVADTKPAPASPSTKAATPAVTETPAPVAEKPVADEIAAESAPAESDQDDTKAEDTAAENNPSAIRDSATAFQSHLQQYNNDVSSIETRIQENEETLDKDSLKACIEELTTTNDEYLKDQEERVEELRKETSDSSNSNSQALQDLKQQLEASLRAQTEQIRTTNDDIRTLDVENDPAAGFSQLVESTATLSSANESLDQSLQQTLVEAETQMAPVEPAEDVNYEDAPTGLLNRQGLEAQLSERWQQEDRTESSLILIDIDGFLDLSKQHGEQAAESIVQVFVELVQAGAVDRDLIAYLGNGNFAIALSQVAPRDATERAESIRQTFQATTFRTAEDEFTASATCAVVQGQPEDDTASLFHRAVETVQEAQRYGRNRTFLYEGDHPSPVLPTGLDIASREVVIGEPNQTNNDQVSLQPVG